MPINEANYRRIDDTELAMPTVDVFDFVYAEISFYFKI